MASSAATVSPVRSSARCTQDPRSNYRTPRRGGGFPGKMAARGQFCITRPVLSVGAARWASLSIGPCNRRESGAWSWDKEERCLPIRWLVARPAMPRDRLRGSSGRSAIECPDRLARVDNCRQRFSARAQANDQLACMVDHTSRKLISRKRSAFIRFVAQSLPSTSRFIAVFRLCARIIKAHHAALAPNSADGSCPPARSLFTSPNELPRSCRSARAATRSPDRRRPCGWSPCRTVYRCPCWRTPASGTAVALHRPAAVGAMERSESSSAKSEIEAGGARLAELPWSRRRNPLVSSSISFGMTLVMAIACGVAAANVYYNQPMLGIMEAAFPGQVAVVGLVPTNPPETPGCLSGAPAVRRAGQPVN